MKLFNKLIQLTGQMWIWEGGMKWDGKNHHEQDSVIIDVIIHTIPCMAASAWKAEYSQLCASINFECCLRR